ncbi:MAG: transposase [Sedimentisphaerales bacterium]|nr:transposase [Sedimentisphaerales bacterium]
MPRKARPELSAKDIRGLKYLRAIDEVLEPLRDVPAHGNRQFFMDQYVALLLLYFFNPVLTSLRSLQQATDLENVQEALGVKRTSLGAMSESAAKVFDPERLLPILQHVIEQLAPLPAEATWEKLPGTLCAMDGTFLRCLPKMVWAVFRQQSDHRGVRLHLQFDILRGTPVSADITEALGSEKKVLQKRLRPGVIYLLDRGYIEYALYQRIHDAGSFFVGRLRDNSSFESLQSRPLTRISHSVVNFVRRRARVCYRAVGLAAG